MNNPMNDWEKLQQAWQAYEPPIRQIEKKINWVSWRMIFILAVDVLVLLGYVYFMFHFLPSDDPVHVKVWNLLMGGVLVIGVYLDFKIRLPLFRLEDRSTSSILKFYLKRVEAGVVLGRIARQFCQWMYPFALAFISVSWWLETENKTERYLFLYLFISLWLGLFWLISRWYENRKQKELEKLQELWREFIDDDSDAVVNRPDQSRHPDQSGGIS